MDAADDVSFVDNKSEDSENEDSQGRRCLENALIDLCGMAWNTDNNLLPAVFFVLQHHFHVGPAELSTLTMVRGITESLFAFPSGFLAEKISRPRLVFIGSMIWAAGLVICGLAQTWGGILAGRFVNGMGLGIVQPLLFSLIADVNPPAQRGRAFGLFQFMGNIASTGGTALATTLGSKTIMGTAGWRFTFFLIAGISAISGTLVVAFVREPNAAALAGAKSKGLASVFWENMPKVCQIFRIPSFLCVLGQGAFGIIPWFVFGFLTMWMELSCFTHSQAAGIYMWFGLGQALCGIFGGFIHDLVAKRYPDFGQPVMCIFMVSIGIPLLAFILFGLGNGVGADAGMIAKYSATFLIFGSLISGCQIVNNSMFAAIVPHAVYSYVYSSDRAVEGTIGALGTPAVGYLTETVFHYNRTAAQSGDCDLGSAKSLASGTLAVSSTAWAICIIFYLVLLCNYPRDRRRQLAFQEEMKLTPTAVCVAPESDSD
eukprot:TRINITY_DN81316_c0_g1_i1.p1 TRINITY_DN81316_c0_g1~~TRINITY_DN81316_c0_g1_i1.p1  ORF type:complete len:486 (-),score=71.29 TRINITY_DN81316_c0_g1_i1:188-1645(-)